MGKTLGYGEITVANMTEPFTVMLTNEAQQFATDSNRKVTSAQSYYTDIIVIRGSQERTDYTIGNITSGSGITVSKSSKRVTFNVSAGTTIGADTGIIEIPITLDGQTVKKQFSWSCGKQGPQGVTGQDGTSIKITSKSVTYQVSTSGTTAPTGTWSTTVPTVNNGQYLWTKTTVQYSDGNKTEAYSVSYKGTNGTNGTSVTVSKTEVTYQVSTSGTTAPTGTWQATMPSCDQGQYLWTKTYVKYSDGKDTTSYGVSYKGVDGEKFAFNMLRETNQGSKHWEQHSSGGKYSVEDFITEDNINAVKLICTEAISTSNWSYVSFKDIKMLKQLKPSTKYTLSYDIKANRSGAISHSICKGDVSNFCTNTVVVNNIIGNETWQHISVVLTTNDLKTTPTNEILYLGRNALSKVGYSIIKNLKLTEGIVDTPWAPHPEDLEGRGVSETIQYYLATSQASGVTSSTSGWSTDITTQKLTADKKYLWNCYQTKYSDGTSEPISTPKVIGVYGDKGQKGDNAKDLSITPSSQYFKSTDGGKTFVPNTITIKPTIQGEISFGKWQYSIDGGVSFADVVSGQKGLSVSNNVLSVNKDSSLYSDAVTMVTFRAVANDSAFYDTCSIAKIYDVSDIGDGRNLWITRDNITLQACEKDKYIYTTTGTSSVCIGATGSSVGTNTIALQTGTKYTISFVISSPSDVGDVMWYFCTALNGTGVKNYGGYGVKLATGENIVSQTITVDTSCDAAGLVLYNLPIGCVIKDIQVEKGSSPTGWTPAPEDVQTAILSTKSEIADVSLKVDKNKQAIEQRVEKTTYQQDLKLVKGDISKANEGLNKWRYEIYPKSLFASEYQGKSTMDVFAKNTNLTPSQSVLINDTDLSIAWNYAENYIGYALTFAKFSAAKSVAITFAHDDGAHIYLNGKLIGGSDAYNNNGESLTLGFVKGWNCIEVVVNEGANTEGFKLGTTISVLSECQLMNCYYGTPVARQSHITNQLVENTTNINGISTKVSKVTSVIGDNGENFTSFKKDYSDFKQTMNGFKTTVGQTYVTKDDFNGLEIGGRNLLLYSQTIRAHNSYYGFGWLTDEVETFNGYHVWSVKNQFGKLAWLFKSHVIDRGLVKVGDTLTYSLYAKTNNASGKSINCSYRFKGDANAYWFNASAFNVGTSWARYSVTFTVTKDMLATDTYMNEIGFEETASMSGDDKVYYACPKLERGTKATDYTEAPEDNEVNGQNLVSNLPSSWEQGGINGGQSVGSTYASIKSSTTYRIRIKDIFSVSGNITISAGGTTTNSSKETLSFYGTLYDTKKGLLRETGWKSFPSTINCGDAKYMSIILRWGDGTKTQITPSDISQICLKVERGTSATPFTLAPEDVNGKIVNVETIANQTAKKFSWIVKGESTSSNLVLTDNALTAIANNINLTGKVTFNSFDQSLKDTINNKTNVSYLNFGSGGNKQGFFKIATLQVKLNYVDQNIIFGVNHRGHGYTECRIKFSNAGNTDPGMGNFKQTGTPTRAWRIIKTATSTWDLYLAKTDSWDGGRVIKFDNPYGDGVLVTWSGASADLPDGAIIAEQMIADQTTIDGGIITTGYLSADRIAGDSITADKIATDAITADKIVANAITADKIATDAIKSRNYISSGGTQGSFLNLSDGSFTSPDLSWDSNGNLIAKNANLSGKITATIGSIGGWNIGDTSLFTGITKSNVRIYDAVNADNAQNMYQKEQHSLILANTYINSFNSSLNSSDNYWHAQGVTINDGEFQVGETLYNPNLVNSDKDEVYYDRGLTRVFGGHITMSRDCSINSDSRSLYADIILNGEELYICTNRNILFSPLRTSIFTTEDPSKYNAIETTGDAIIGGNMVLRDRSNGNHKIAIYPYDGCIEMYGNTPYIDFHYGSSTSDYTSRIIAQKGWDCLNFTGSIELGVDLYAGGYIYNSSSGHYTWNGRTDAYISCGNYSGGNNIYYYANYHAFYVNNDSGSGMMYINTNGVTSRVGFTKTSDERIKKNFESFDDNIIDAYMNIEPVKYQLKQSSNDNYHFGFKAQHVDKVFSDYGDTYNESFDICTSRPIDPDKAKELYGVDGMVEEYELRYDELIAPTTYMVQHIYKELAKVKQEKADLETRLQAIEAKLGL